MKLPKSITPAIIILNASMALMYFAAGWFLLSSEKATAVIGDPYHLILGGLLVFYGFYRSYRAYAKYHEVKNR